LGPKLKHLVLAAAILSTCFFSVLVLPELSFASETATYEYDALGRLEKVTRDDGIDTTVVDYEYDSAGNRKKRTVGDGSGGGGGPSNSPPDASADLVMVTQNSHTYAFVTANDSDPDGDPLTITAVSQPSNGFVTIHNAITLKVFGTQTGTSTFAYTISDGNGGTDIAMVNVFVSGGGGCPPFPTCPFD
jgi:hypothetical protein